jgi:N-methylhydantoinase B
MCERFGTGTYLSALEALLQRNYDAMKVLLQMVFEEGRTLSFTDYICDDGVGYGPYELKLSLTRTGDKVHLDFTGSSPQAHGPINYYINENLTRMFFGIYMITVADPQILWNDGFYPLVDVTIPDGSYWKPKHPAALNGRNHGIGRVFDLFGGLLGQTNPALLNAAGLSSSPHFMYSGNYSGGERKGEWFQLYSIGFGGIPGRPLGDGPDGHSLWPSFVNIPCEYLESYYPLRIEKWETVADTGGAGLHRGGNGVDVAYVFEEPGEIAIHDDRWLTYPWGVNGGTPGARGTKWIERAAGGREVLPSKCHDVKVFVGDVLHFVTWGGGGWGDPLERDPELVAKEVRRGLVTADGALRYGVCVTEEGTVDAEATQTLRDQLRADRPDPLPVFDMGPSIPELLARCEEETGLPAPTPPVWV